MARFVNTISYVVTADNAWNARQDAETVVRVGTDHQYFRDAAVVSVEPVAELIYTQAEFDAAVRTVAAETEARVRAEVNSNA